MIIDSKERFCFSVLGLSVRVEGFGSQYIPHSDNANKVLKMVTGTYLVLGKYKLLLISVSNI